MATNKDFRVKNGLVVEQDANIGGNLVVTGTITGDGSGLSGVTSYTQTDFDNDFATKSTTDLAEGTNLYYTDARFDTRLATKDTDDLAEGTNLYYTTARANSDFDSRLTLKSTSDLTEGANLYYTTTRANTDFDTRLATKDTDDLAEGTSNLYYTDTRVGSYLSSNIKTINGTSLIGSGDITISGGSSLTDTDDLSEGSTNLYYTDARVSSYLTTNNYATQSYVATQIGTKLDASSYTASDVLAKIKTLDGDGSGLDADLLDGQDGSYYQQALVSGINIKTINGTSVLGSGDITVISSETDPVFTASAAGGIDSTDISHWDTAYGWGDHSVAGYLTSTSLSGYATESYVGTQIANLVDSAPATLDTLNELAAALGDDANFASTITTSLSGKQETLVSGTNIKTINGTSLLGSGDITISGGSSLTDTDDLTEGSTNLYYTTARANSDFDTRLATKSTTNLSEGTNLYYTDARVGSYLTTNNYATLDNVNQGLASKQDVLESGTNIKTINGTSLLGSDDIKIGSITSAFPGTLTTPYVGTSRRYLLEAITLTKAGAFVSTLASSNIGISILKNGVVEDNITILSNTNYVALSNISISCVEGDYLTINITSGSPVDLVVVLI